MMPDDLQQRIERLLPSQKCFMLSPARERMMMAGWRWGKTRILCTTGVLLSYLIPDNLGFIGRASAKDLHSTTLKTFFDEVCPPEMIVGKPRKIGQSGTEVTLRTRFPGYTSKIYFDYIIDKSSGKSHLAGGNWGWFGVDQVEEINRADWHKLMGRLSRTYLDPETRTRKPIKTHALGVGNQQGHDWIFEDFFEGGDYILDPAKEPHRFFKTVHRDLPAIGGKTFSRLGIIGRSEENKISNGGFVPDDYFDGLRASMSRQWIARYMDGSFDDFSGKIYGDYNLQSVHNIKPFKIPSHWPRYCIIDPGGSVPWGITLGAIDEVGNKIVTNSADELYAKSRLSPNEAVRWVRANTDLRTTRYIIDYQNIPVMELFREAEIHCEPAVKGTQTNINMAISEFYVHPGRALPAWYKDTQPLERYEKFKGGGAPKVYVFTEKCESWRREHDNWIWDPVKKNVPKDMPNHHCDNFLYWCASNPQSATGLPIDPYGSFRNSDPTSAFHLDQVQKELARLCNQDEAALSRNSEPCDGGIVDPDATPAFITDCDFGNYA